MNLQTEHSCVTSTQTKDDSFPLSPHLGPEFEQHGLLLPIFELDVSRITQFKTLVSGFCSLALSLLLFILFAVGYLMV